MSWWKRLLRREGEGGPRAAEAGPGTDLAAADERLLRASIAGDLAGARGALAAGARVDATTKGEEKLTYAGEHARFTVSMAGGATALLLAARAGQLDLVELLLEKGAAVNAEEGRGQRALSLAAEGGHVEVAALLLSRGAELEARSRAGLTALHAAASHGETRVVQFLLDRGARADARTDSGSTAVGTALHNGYPEVVRLLLEKGATLDEAQAARWAPMAQKLERVHREAERIRPLDAELMQACVTGDASGAQRLLAEGARPDEPDKFGSAPLAVAALKGHLEVVRVLLAGGADPNAKGKRGITALQRAVESGAEPIVELLLERGAKLGARDDGTTPLHHAAGGGHAALAVRLLAAGADVRAPDARGTTALHWATSAAVGRALLAAGADANARDGAGETPLHAAAAAGRLDVAELLVERGAEVDARSAGGRTPAGLANLRNHQDLVRFLAARGADVTSLPEPVKPRTPAEMRADLLRQGNIVIIDETPHRRAPAGPAALSVTCASCGRAYAIGRDAILVTLDLALQQFKAVVRVGADGSPSSGPPDLVEAAETVRAEHRAAALAQAEETARPVIAALKEGQARRWRCNRCQHVNAYPAFAPPVKPAVQPPAVALMECPPFAGKGRCSDDACPCSDTAIPPAKGYLFLSEELCDFRRDCLARDAAEAKWRQLAARADPLEQLQLMVKKILFPTLVCEQGARQRGLDLEVAAADYDMWVRTSKVPCRPTPRSPR